MWGKVAGYLFELSYEPDWETPARIAAKKLAHILWMNESFRNLVAAELAKLEPGDTDTTDFPISTNVNAD